MSSYQIKSQEEYFQVYQQSIQKPEIFWNTIAKEHFMWRKQWDNVINFDFDNAHFKWFDGAELNITENCIDRHLLTRGDKTALLFEPNDPSQPNEHITYSDLYHRVCKMANVLYDMGIEKGDRVCVYLPMIPELVVTVLACARVGAVHSVVFAGFSAVALSSRIVDSSCKMVVTSDGSFRGSKIIPLKPIVDEALKECTSVKHVLVVERTKTEIVMEPNRDFWLAPLLEKASAQFPAVVVQAEDPLFILYTSGSTGSPKGMLHTCAGYMVYAGYSFNNVFQYQEEDTFWCSADVGWITGHSYIIYGPLLNGATSLLYEGILSFPDFGRFWDIIAKHKVNQFYTAPTAIRALAKESLAFVKDKDLSTLKVIGTVGEPINEEAWHWYNNNIGKKNCPVVDTWFQTETGGILISPIPYATPTIPTYATLPLPGIQLALMDDVGNEIKGNQVEGRLCIKYPWPSMARTIWGDHKRYQETYFSSFKKMYFTGDGARRNEVGYYRITGRVDDVIIVSGHNLGTAPIEDAINEHPHIAESAVVGFPHDIKGNALYGYVILKDLKENHNLDTLRTEINALISERISPIAKLDKIQFTVGLPKTRSGKIMRRILRKIANKEGDQLGDISTLLNPQVIQEIIDNSI
ncbi:acetate--CoA ligase [Dokdonia sinensis]|uniref:Acetate--CoA ligase n=1 Tax=Dokdonia sinensis TaxID=2479847 RepID=A0A3M0G5X1_9FLAO|nr:acetate--CoA ligase [Dokdonia sinensis]RMB60441.1 acetate--CoA ligase [Dokdonia sinensis]